MDLGSKLGLGRNYRTGDVPTLLPGPRTSKAHVYYGMAFLAGFTTEYQPVWDAGGAVV